VYVGTRPGRSAEVVVVALVESRMRILDVPLQGLRFEWGELSCGSLVLAQVLLNDATGRPAHGRVLRKFQADVVATMPRERLVLTDAEIRSWLIASVCGARR
jgi:hypothetical protein